MLSKNKIQLYSTHTNRDIKASTDSRKLYQTLERMKIQIFEFTVHAVCAPNVSSYINIDDLTFSSVCVCVLVHTLPFLLFAIICE